jgi:predicted nuclease of restriction endonuclease-like (RecB) superfamily
LTADRLPESSGRALQVVAGEDRVAVRLKDPYVLEFLELKDEYSESDLQQRAA